MELDRIRTVMEEAISATVLGIHFPGIVGAAMKNVAISSEQLGRVATQLEQHGNGETSLSAEVELFLRALQYRRLELDSLHRVSRQAKRPRK